MRVIIENTYKEISDWVSLYIKKKINSNKSFPFVLGLPTGSTPLQVYKNLIEYYKKGELSFKNVITFNMDEYVGLSPKDIQSYHYFMYENFFKYIDIPSDNINLLNGLAINLKKECEEYENKIQKYKIDLFLCGIGSDGHIAFNEPGSSLSSITRIKTLSEETINDNSRFFNSLNDVPKQALTVGLKTIMSAKEIIIMASGYNKSKAIQQCLEGSISTQWTCTISQNHPKAIVICDDKATQELKVKTYNYYKNIQKIVDLYGNPIINYIKQNINDKFMITSPHPDDDVIGMGGTMQLLPIKNCKIVYLTNGIGGLKEQDNMGSSTRIKEAISSVKVLGYNPDQVIDVKLPFYFTNNRKVTNKDFTKMNLIIENEKPNHIFICVDEDPKKTHIKCAKILQKCKLHNNYIKYIWLYKSAWGNWNNSNINHNTKIYIDKNNFERKLLSIDMHFSQNNPLVTKNKKINSFKDIVKKINKSEQYPGNYEECFKKITVDEFINLKL